MAELRNVTKRNAISDFRRVTPQAGFALRALGDMALEAYGVIAPIAAEDQRQRGAEAGREAARQQQGSRPRQSAPQRPQADGGLSGVGQPPAAGAPIPAVGTSAEGDTPEAVARDARDTLSAMPASLIQTESGGDFGALNNEVGAGGVRGHGGRGQFGQARLDDAARAGVIPAGTTPQQFANMPPETQIAVENWHIGEIDQAIDQTGAIGQEIQGVPVTRDGLRAVAHLGGVAGMRRFIETGGEYNPSDSFGTSLLAYLDTHGQGATTQVSTRTAPETTIRTADGKIEPRLFSPASDPILQAYNAAFGVSYISETSVRGLENLMQMSQEQRGNPSAFMEQAEAYVDQIVEQAPDMFKEDLRSSLATEAQRRYLGMLDEQQRETEQRANNSSKALMDRYSTDYAQALASGRPEDAAAARAQLENILYARESLPGIAWTREQSENTLLGAMDEAQRMRSAQSRAMSDEWKAQFGTVIAAANDGRSSDFDALVTNEAAVAAHPELAREAMAMMTVRDSMPAFMSAPPAVQQEILQQERERSIGAEWETDILDAMTKFHDNTVKALEEDPVQYGMDHIQGAPPPLDPALAATDPEAFVNAMEARSEFAARLQGEGWVDTPAYLTNAEVETFSALLSKDTPAEIRTALASTIVSGFGPDAARVLGELNADPVTVHGAQLMAAGGPASQATFMQALQGQELLDANQVQLPTGSGRIASFAPDAAVAMQGLPNAGAAQDQITKFAQALYASQASGLDPASEDAKLLMQQATQRALGQRTLRNGTVVGGVQTVGGHPVLLPTGVAGSKVEEVVMGAFSAPQAPETIGDRITSGMMLSPTVPTGLDATVWQRANASGATPMYGGRPMPRSIFTDDSVRFVSVGGSTYRMEVVAGASVHDITDENGMVFFFDIKKLIGD